jgi:hypothetical protein
MESCHCTDRRWGRKVEWMGQGVRGLPSVGEDTTYMGEDRRHVEQLKQEEKKKEVR